MQMNSLAKASVLLCCVASVASAKPTGSCSGFAIGNGSFIITSNHVVEGCSEINIPNVGSATIFKSDPRADLAILKPSQPLPLGLPFRSGQPIKLGEEVVVLGYPLRGLLSSPPTVTTGIVSSLAGMHDDRTVMQISAPVQPGNSGGPVLDRAGNIVGLVDSKLNAVQTAIVTGDIPQNVNFAINATIVTSLLDSYAIKYDIGTFDSEKSIANIVASAVSAVVVVECEKKAAPSLIVSSSAPLPRLPPAPVSRAAQRTALVCGRSVDYVFDAVDGSQFLGAWGGYWNNPGRLCGGLIVEKIAEDETAEIIYIYGPSQPGSRLVWKQQRQRGMIGTDGRLSFRDDQGSTFVFELTSPGMLNAAFSGVSGKLIGSFQKF